MAPKVYDIIVVGTGPAGNTLSLKAAQKGYKVLIIEKGKLPREKTCAGGIPIKALDLIGLDFDTIVERKIKGAYLSFRNESIVHYEMPDIGITVIRSRFDHFMTQEAVRAGCELAEETEFRFYEQYGSNIKAVTSRGSYLGKVLVGADGVYSKVRKCMRPDKRVWLAHAIEALVYPEENMLDLLGDNCLFDLGGIPRGYGWIFPKKDHFNIGLFKNRNRPENANMRSRLDLFIRRNRILRGHKSMTVKGYPIPIRPISPDLAKDNVLLVGDAAGFGESFYGEGIMYAVWSSALAITAITDLFTHGRPLSLYNSLVRPIVNTLFFSRVMSGLFYRAPRFGYYHIALNRWVNVYFAQLINRKVSHIECFLKAILFSPLWFFAPKQGEISNKQDFC